MYSPLHNVPHVTIESMHPKLIPGLQLQGLEALLKVSNKLGSAEAKVCIDNKVDWLYDLYMYMVQLDFIIDTTARLRGESAKAAPVFVSGDYGYVTDMRQSVFYYDTNWKSSLVTDTSIKKSISLIQNSNGR